jgi:hypothetical protein
VPRSKKGEVEEAVMHVFVDGPVELAGVVDWEVDREVPWPLTVLAMEVVPILESCRI